MTEMDNKPTLSQDFEKRLMAEIEKSKSAKNIMETLFLGFLGVSRLLLDALEVLFPEKSKRRSR